MTRAGLLGLLSLLAVLAIATTAQAEKAPIYTGFLSNAAVQGYDPVAYFTQAKPVKGHGEFSTVYMGAEFRFSSAENLAIFKNDPAKYAPQFGGYCAWAVSQGYTAKGDAQYWRIVDGKLYLNYNADVQRRWAQDIPRHIGMGEKNWPGVLQ